MKTLIYTIALCIAATLAYGQDVAHTQYFTTPLLLNPAMAGLISQDYRITTNFAYKYNPASSRPNAAKNISYDMSVLKSKLRKGDAIGIGITAGYAQANDETTNKISTAGLALAYHKSFGHNRSQHISLGVQGQLINEKIDIPGIFNVTSTSSDAAAGIMYSGALSAHTAIYGGYSYGEIAPFYSYHAGGYTATFSGLQSAYIGGAFSFGNNLVLYANALYSLQQSGSVLRICPSLGFAVTHNLRNNITVCPGLWYCHQESIAPYLGIEYARLRLGVSYDMNISRFTPATSGIGSTELSLTYSGWLGKGTLSGKNGWTCPKMFL